MALHPVISVYQRHRFELPASDSESFIYRSSGDEAFLQMTGTLKEPKFMLRVSTCSSLYMMAPLRTNALHNFVHRLAISIPTAPPTHRPATRTVGTMDGLMSDKSLTYRPAEVHSQASFLSKNKYRKIESMAKQAVGRKVDGLVVSSATMLELRAKLHKVSKRSLHDHEENHYQPKEAAAETDDNTFALLLEKHALNARLTKVDLRAVQYFVRMRMSPTPRKEDFMVHIRRKHTQSKNRSEAIGDKIKKVFCDRDPATLLALRSVAAVDEFIEAFEDDKETNLKCQQSLQILHV
ncbi:hypothetical protein BGZ94_008622 [Podila epigama]|nr:hypothetical protein BGZ94_008622 [Podila epigama]